MNLPPRWHDETDLTAPRKLVALAASVPAIPVRPDTWDDVALRAAATHTGPRLLPSFLAAVAVGVLLVLSSRAALKGSSEPAPQAASPVLVASASARWKQEADGLVVLEAGRLVMAARSAQLIRQLAVRGLKVCAHPKIHEVAEIYEQLGMPVGARRFDGAFLENEVGLFPPFRRGDSLAHVGPRSLAALTGWALEPWGARRSGADVAFPVSDHADFPSLVAYAQKSGAREVITVHGFAAELAKELRGLGVFARAVTEQVQMVLL